MNSIRVEISRIIGYTIPRKGWQVAFDSLVKEGRLTNKHLIQIIALLLEREEARENEN